MTLEQRVAALEQRVTRYRGATMTMALVLVAGVVMGQASWRDAGAVAYDSVVSQSFFVTTDDFNQMATVQKNESGGYISLSNKEGEEVVVIGVGGDGSGYISIRVSDGRERVGISGEQYRWAVDLS